jgi:hypothetical protein
LEAEACLSSRGFQSFQRGSTRAWSRRFFDGVSSCLIQSGSWGSKSGSSLRAHDVAVEEFLGVMLNWVVWSMSARSLSGIG